MYAGQHHRSAPPCLSFRLHLLLPTAQHHRLVAARFSATRPTQPHAGHCPISCTAPSNSAPQCSSPPPHAPTRSNAPAPAPRRAPALAGLPTPGHSAMPLAPPHQALRSFSALDRAPPRPAIAGPDTG
jgi:hypothetical protein